MNISISYFSSAGGRAENEDTVCVNEFNNGLAAVVADGLGGHKEGKLASELAVKIISSELISSNKTIEDIKIAIDKANSEIINSKKGSDMCTTVAMVCIDKLKAIAAHVGDSRVYQFRDSDIIYQSVDHSVSQMAVSVGEIQKSEIRGHEDRNKLLRALGNSYKHDPYLKELDVIEGDGFLVCSDGFWELLLEDEMSASFCNSSNAGEWLDAMRLYVDRRITEKSDNNTAVAIMVGK